MKRWQLRACVIAVTMAICSASSESAPMQPFQMVRSLQLLQDRIANGDHAALPMQQKMLGLIDKRLRALKAEDFADQRNFRALLIYGLSGGNPRTLDLIFARLAPAEEGNTEAAIGQAILHYAKGDYETTREMLRDAKPRTLAPEIGPSLALVAATVMTPTDPTLAARFLDDARLLSPGTLIEEAALRRSLALSATLKDPDRFARASMQYVRRFIRSPYANQFAEAFVSSVVDLRETLDFAVVEDVVSQMNDEQARTIYLRLARKSAIEDYDRLLAFASQKARSYTQPDAAEDDPRAVLYSNMASVTSENVDDILGALKGIDPKRLSQHDRELLDAAKAIAEAVVTAPPKAKPASTPAAQEAEPPAPVETIKAGLDGEVPSMAEAYVRQTLGKLEAIDRLLVEDAL